MIWCRKYWLGSHPTDVSLIFPSPEKCSKKVKLGKHLIYGRKNKFNSYQGSGTDGVPLFEQLSQQVIHRAKKLADEQGFAICISVVDDAGLLRYFVRMDGAVPCAIDVSLKKARTAALFRTNSAVLGQQAQRGTPLTVLALARLPSRPVL